MLLRNKCLAELTGTFALVFCGTGAIIINQETGGAVTNVGIAITFGSIIMTMILALGNISGAHFNPAVTISFWVAKRFEGKMVIPYIVSQLSGALLASIVLHFLFPRNRLLGSTLPAGSEMQSFVLEVVLSFFLMLVILNMAAKAMEKGSATAIAVGITVLLEAMFAGPICGASMNPARSIGPALVSGNLQHLWIYIAAPFAGMLLSIPVGQLLHTKPVTIS